MNDASAWYPISLSSSIEPGTSAGARLLGREVVVWRDAAGKPQVWEDRCPHRGMRLSFGFVRGDRINCIYHGWRYDGQGRCRFIPAHPDLEVPETIRVRTYPVSERFGMIWTSLDEDPPPAPFAGEVTGSIPIRSLYLACSREGVFAALREASSPAVSPFPAATQFEEPEANLFCLSSGNDRILLGAQPIASDRTGLHIAIAGNSARYDVTAQRHFLRWASTLRGSIAAIDLVI